MPHALIALPDVYESVVRRVAVDVTTQLADIMRLPGDTQVMLPGRTGSIPLNGGTFGSRARDNLRYPGEGRLLVTYNETIDESAALIAPVHRRKEHVPVFYDDVRGITIRPVYRYVTFTVSLQYTSPSMVESQRWLDEMRSRVSMLRAELYQDLEYHWGWPAPIDHLLRHLHDAMETSAQPLGMPYDDWRHKYTLRPTTHVATETGTHKRLVFPERQYEVLGWFDFTATPPDPERRGDGSGTYTAEVSYTFNYDRPVQLYAHWPMVIHQNPIGRDYRPEQPYETYRKHPRRVSYTKRSFEEMNRFLESNGIPYIHYPDVDDWVPPMETEHGLTFFTGLLTISPDDRRSLLALDNLGDVTFTQPFLTYFQHQGNALFDRDGLFEFRLYQNDRLMTEVNLELDGLMVKADRDLDMTRQYHIQIALQRNWVKLGREKVECLRRYPEVTYWSLRALGVLLQNAVSFEELKTLGAGYTRPARQGCPGDGGTGGTVPGKDLEDAIVESDAKSDKIVDRVSIGPFNVLYAQLLSLRNTDDQHP